MPHCVISQIVTEKENGNETCQLCLDLENYLEKKWCDLQPNRFSGFRPGINTTIRSPSILSVVKIKLFK